MQTQSVECSLAFFRFPSQRVQTLQISQHMIRKILFLA
jgi:hypothetical protein